MDKKNRLKLYQVRYEAGHTIIHIRSEPISYILSKIHIHPEF